MKWMEWIVAQKYSLYYRTIGIFGIFVEENCVQKKKISLTVLGPINRKSRIEIYMWHTWLRWGTQAECYSPQLGEMLSRLKIFSGMILKGIQFFTEYFRDAVTTFLSNFILHHYTLLCGYTVYCQLSNHAFLVHDYLGSY